MVSATERERWVLYQLLNPMGQQNRADGRRLERLWDALGLDEIEDKVRVYAPGTQLDARIFDDVERKNFPTVTSEQRDFMIELLDKPGLTLSGRRMIRKFESAMIIGRDGEAAKAS